MAVRRIHAIDGREHRRILSRRGRLAFLQHVGIRYPGFRDQLGEKRLVLFRNGDFMHRCIYRCGVLDMSARSLLLLQSLLVSPFELVRSRDGSSASV